MLLSSESLVQVIGVGGAASILAAAVLRDEDLLGVISSIVAWPIMSLRRLIRRRRIIRRRRLEAKKLADIYHEADWLLTKLPPMITMQILDILPPPDLGSLRLCSRQCQLVVDNSNRRRHLIISEEGLIKFSLIPLSSLHASVETIHFKLQSKRAPLSWASQNYIKSHKGLGVVVSQSSSDEAESSLISKCLSLAKDSLLLEGILPSLKLDFTQCEPQTLDPLTLAKIVMSASSVNELVLSTEALILDSSKHRSLRSSNSNLPLASTLSALATVARGVRSGVIRLVGSGLVIRRDDDFKLIALDTMLTSRLHCLYLLDAHLYSGLRWSILLSRPLPALKTLAVSLGDQASFDALLKALLSLPSQTLRLENILIEKTEGSGSFLARYQDLVRHLSGLTRLKKLEVPTLSLEGETLDQEADEWILPSLSHLALKELIVSEPSQKIRLLSSFPNLVSLCLGSQPLLIEMKSPIHQNLIHHNASAVSTPFQYIPNPLLNPVMQGGLLAPPNLAQIQQQSAEKRLSISDLRCLSRIEELSLAGSAAAQIAASIKASLTAGDFVAGQQASLLPHLTRLNLMGAEKEDLSLLISLLSKEEDCTVDLTNCIFSEESVTLISDSVASLSVRGDSSSLLVKLLSEGNALRNQAKIERLSIYSNSTLLPEDIESLLLSATRNDSPLMKLKFFLISKCPHVHVMTAPILQSIANESSRTSESIYITINET